MFHVQVLAATAATVADAESTVRSLTNEASQRRSTSDASGDPHRQGFEALRLQDTVAALPSGFEFAEAVAYDAMNAPQAAGGEARLGIGVPSQKLYQTQNGGAFLKPNGERYHASATDHYGGLGGSGGSGGYGFPDAMRYYHYGSGPKAYNTEHAYAYEKVYPERTYSTNHATSYEKHYDDNDNKGGPWAGGGYESRFSSSYPIRGGGGGGGYGYRHGDGYGKGSGSGYGAKGYESRYDSRPAAASSTRSRRRGGARAGPKIKRYVYKNPYDKSTTRVVEMHSSRGRPSWAASNENRQIWKPDDMEQFVLGLMRNG
ncbi:hypothetical protein HPB52_023927 [Rhipicephalus sanguineus]|uniref:Uncharacterized protein n=1 Tax=Rhipicephalus sanguineus TaxID=34632 RepID=A0A9D4Q8X2_RHISA|nr:hypothetical protein HPB52_023927 [Rhipicephalus sanguineus]